MLRYRAIINFNCVQHEVIKRSLSKIIPPDQVVKEKSEEVVKENSSKTSKLSKEIVKKKNSKDYKTPEHVINENSSRVTKTPQEIKKRSSKITLPKNDSSEKTPPELLKRSLSKVKNTQKEMQQSQIDNQGEYFEEFMKLLKRQRELPFIFSSKRLQFEKVDLKMLNPALKYNQKQGFSFYGIKDEIVERLKKNGITQPLEVQQKSLTDLMQGKKAIIESSTGSGKTLTFLLPILNDLGTNSCANIIIVPTRELTSQIHKEIVKYIDDPNLVVRFVSGVDQEQERKLKNALRECKVLISTPKRFLEILEENSGHFHKVKRLVLDEVDKLLPFSSLQSKASRKRVGKPKPTEKIVTMIKHYNKHLQLIATSATISRNLVQELEDIGFTNNCSVIKLYPNEYRFGCVPENIKNLFTIVSANDLDSKLRWCIKLFAHQKLTSALMFINRTESVENTVKQLQDLGVSATALYKELLLPSPKAIERFIEDFKTGVIKFVVSNEETVRGMDFPFVENVYMTYVPDSPEAYLHLAGRVGRLGQPGTAIVFISEENKETELKHLKRRYALLGIKGKRLELK